VLQVWPWLDATFYSFLPFSILLVFNTLIIYCHHQAVQRKRTLRATPGGVTVGRANQQVSFNRRLTIMLLVVSFTFMLMTGPRVILLSIRRQVFPFIRSDNSIDFEMVRCINVSTKFHTLTLIYVMKLPTGKGWCYKAEQIILLLFLISLNHLFISS
jgi:hypothetical protein